ncbi:2-amino-4-hydroxy-6-hydroxymethyldihydropteridine diphosphokinase [uncultured Alistipes sp.]|uniref:2-amino-4-hydroxy-6- hydroxymethyldihydropteridine diphosphokinase n=1 Tax=uncultured Alistipes sp. TaxID=538949 RepID=UPI002623B3EB|nr:2-amino-4-hydroxy-6-hydroxymethyldihydropteridine diphosphokinase [uncultured Alistipes sp.]
MARAVLLMGGNLGDVKDRLLCAQQLINSRIGAVLRCSHCYVSAPWGFEAPQPFMNQVVIVSTDHTPQELLAQIHRIERELGRNRASEAVEKAATGQRYVSRPIDIDILFYDDAVISTPELTIPHPGIAEREFVLAPLCEVMRDRRHPVLGRTMGELREILKNGAPVRDADRTEAPM